MRCIGRRNLLSTAEFITKILVKAIRYFNLALLLFYNIQCYESKVLLVCVVYILDIFFFIVSFELGRMFKEK